MFEPPASDANPKARLTAITLDSTSIKRGNSGIEHEREVAIFDILESNFFSLDGRDEGPYTLNLAIAEDRLVLAVGQQASDAVFTVVLSLTPLRRVMSHHTRSLTGPRQFDSTA